MKSDALPTPPAATVPACARCRALAADARRREPHAGLALQHTAPVTEQCEAGVAYSKLTFVCRDCGTEWRLYDRAGEPFVAWAPARPLTT
ncbi:hypothetical protein [Cupriavidus malaysiensis]|nr:hypothetical protein [Cupriavidus malaysiensis]